MRDTPGLLAECRILRQRRSGPGGQHRNKVETAIVLIHEPSGIRGEASERRSQAENKKVAVQRLRIKLALSIRSAAGDEASAAASRLWRSRLHGTQISVSASHTDFPALLAESLDVIYACEFDCKAAAERLGCSPSQLIKLLKVAPEALALVNQQRIARGTKALQ